MHSAELDLSYCEVRAPFTGRLGVRAVDIGQFVSAGTTIVTLQALDPIYVDFFLPQQKLKQISLEQEVALKIDTYPDRTFRGTISAINPKVDVSTRNIQVRATFQNPDHLLMPGQFIQVRLLGWLPGQAGLDLVDLFDLGPELPQFAVVPRPEHFFDDGTNHFCFLNGWRT